MVLYRLMQWARRRRLPPLALMFNKLNAVLNNCIIGRGAEFGPRFVLIHATGVVINGEVRGGSDVRIEHQVTIGAERRQSARPRRRRVHRRGRQDHRPACGSGSDARIGANAVVVRDVPSALHGRSASRRGSSGDVSRIPLSMRPLFRPHRWRSHEEFQMTIVVEIVFWGCVALIVYAYVAYPLLVWTLSRFFGRMPVCDAARRRRPAGGIGAHRRAQRREGDRRTHRECAGARLSAPTTRGRDRVGRQQRRNGAHRPARRRSPGPAARSPLRRGKATVLNAAFRALRGEIVLLSDANTFTEPDAPPPDRAVVRGSARRGGVRAAGSHRPGDADGTSTACIGGTRRF